MINSNTQHEPHNHRQPDVQQTQTYGDIGEEYIHVHHLVDISTLGEGYEIDPKKDLRPVCANCHSMLHTERPAMSIAALKKRLTRIGNAQAD